MPTVNPAFISRCHQHPCSQPFLDWLSGPIVLQPGSICLRKTGPVKKHTHSLKVEFSLFRQVILRCYVPGVCYGRSLCFLDSEHSLPYGMKYVLRKSRTGVLGLGVESLLPKFNGNIDKRSAHPQPGELGKPSWVTGTKYQGVRQRSQVNQLEDS